MTKEDWNEFHDLFEEYENRKTDEAIFVYDCDKLQPIIQCVMNKWKSWHECKMDFNDLWKNKTSKISDKFGWKDILKYYFDRAKNENICFFS